MKNIIYALLITFIACQGTTNTSIDNHPTPNEKSPQLGNNILVIFQDSKNNYWFGGNEEAVYKYDGQQLYQYSAVDGLLSTSILSIQEDKTGNLYFDTTDDVFKYDGNTFTPLEIGEESIWALEEDDLWFRIGWGHKGPFRYDGKKLHRLEFPETARTDFFYNQYPNAPFSPSDIYSMYKDSKGHMWFGTSAVGLCRYDGETISWLYEEHLRTTPEGGDFGIRSMVEDSDGDFWFSNANYRYQIDAKSVQKEDAFYLNYKRKAGISIENTPYFFTMLNDDNGNLWMVTYDDGVWQKKGEKMIHHPIKQDNKNVLLFSLYKDNEGTLWVGTHNNGAWRWNGNEFELFIP